MTFGGGKISVCPAVADNPRYATGHSDKGTHTF